MADQQFQYREDAIGLFNGTTNFEDYFGSMRPGATFRRGGAGRDAGTHRRPRVGRLLQRQDRRIAGRADGARWRADHQQDTADYRVKWREPMRIDWRGNSLYTAPLPSSGGIAPAQLIGIKERRAADFEGVELNSARYIHLLAEIEKRVFADRADYGRSGLSDVPVKRLTSPEYLAQRAAEINPTAISATEKVRPGPESHQTTHFSIVDADGSGEQHLHPQHGLRQRRGGQGCRLAQRRNG